jgi:hypothetical protein
MATLLIPSHNSTPTPTTRWNPTPYLLDNVYNVYNRIRG